MKPTQLANVLIKTTGLYVCVCSIPGLVSGMCAVYVQDAWRPNGYEMSFGIWSYLIGAVTELVAGIILIVMSQKIAGFWFKNDE